MTSEVVGPPRNFDLDRFQTQAIEHLEAGRSVVVSAPTGSGKTFVAEHAIALARSRGQRSLYTTPIKALSNQKFRDLRGWLGGDHVGLLTGDNSINGDASAVVMTTEVLRNMLYAEPERLANTSVVVMDEVHYLQNNFRGPVWEEVIIHLPSHIQIVALSATVSNASELADWISSVHAPCAAVTEKRRPVQLHNSFFVAEKSARDHHVIDTLVKGRANPKGKRYDPAPRQRRGKGKSHRQGPPQKRPWRSPRRHEVITELERRNLLPAITFIFSRAGCEDAVSQLRTQGVTLTDQGTADKITEVVERRTAHLSDNDRRALGYAGWLAALQAGIAAHHAGIVPLFKETVEELFTAGYLKAIFATETLALGINMPARTVVIEKLTKFTGEHHEMLSPSDYTQLTGRAGRRGIDSEGHAIVLWTPYTQFSDVAGLANSMSFELRSAFRPTYNMTCHLVSRYSRSRAEELMAKSFGQFQADRAVRDLEERRARVASELGEQQTTVIEDVSPDQTAEIAAAISKLKPGEVIEASGPVVVLSTAWRRKEVQVRVIDRSGETHVIDPEALSEPPTVVGSVQLPEPFNPTSRSHQHDLVGQLRGVHRRSSSKKKRNKAKQDNYAKKDTTDTQPPGPWRDEDSRRLRKDLRRLDARISERKDRLNDRFRAVVGLLTELGYIENWSLTGGGETLLGTFHELDLAIVESLRAGHLDGHEPATLAGVVSCFVYEARGRDEAPPPWFPNEEARKAVAGIQRIVAEVQRLESAYGLPESREIDAGLLAATHGWAAGGGLGDILDTESLSGGDFVRSMKQVTDVLTQIAHVAPNKKTRSVAHRAVELVQRGIVDAPVDLEESSSEADDEAVEASEQDDIEHVE